MIATIATASGIGGATFFAPLFVLALGIPPELAVGTALITEVFGLWRNSAPRAPPLATCTSERIEPDILKAVLDVGLFAVAANSLPAPE